MEGFRHAFSSSARVPLGMTGKVCLKSPESTNVTPPMMTRQLQMSWRVWSKDTNAALWDIVHSSQTIIQQIFRRFPRPDPLMMLQVALSLLVRFRGNLNAEWTVQSPGSSVIAINEAATVRAIFSWRQTMARERVVTNVFPVPPGASRK